MLYDGLFHDAGTAAHLSDGAELAAMLRVEAALAQVQGALGIIPAESAAFLARHLPGLVLDPAAMAGATALNGVPVPALADAVRAALARPDHTAWLHWGATSQDIMDTGLSLRLQALLDLWEARMQAAAQALAALALAQADQPMAARTYGQHATPTSFGSVVAGWGWPLLTALEALPALRVQVQRVSLSGAAGTLSAMGPKGPQVRAGLAEALGLHDPGRSWHGDRSGVAALAGWAVQVAGALGKMGEDLTLMTQSGLGLVRISGAGASSTMPQKQNPVGPSALVALARHVQGLAATLTGAGLHRQQRDGAAWFTEWLALPPLCQALGRMTVLAGDLAMRVQPDSGAMAHDLEAGFGQIHAEGLSFALVAHAGLDRPAAQARVKALCATARETSTPLLTLAAQDVPGPDWAALVRVGAMGSAPTEARDFAARVAARATR